MRKILPLLLIAFVLQSYKPIEFPVPVQGGQGIVMFGVVTNTASDAVLTVTYGADTLINNQYIPAGMHYQRLDYGGWPIPTDGAINVYGISDTEFLAAKTL